MSFNTQNRETMNHDLKQCFLKKNIKSKKFLCALLNFIKHGNLSNSDTSFYFSTAEMQCLIIARCSKKKHLPSDLESPMQKSPFPTQKTLSHSFCSCKFARHMCREVQSVQVHQQEKGVYDPCVVLHGNCCLEMGKIF